MCDQELILQASLTKTCLYNINMITLHLFFTRYNVDNRNLKKVHPRNIIPKSYHRRQIVGYDFRTSDGGTTGWMDHIPYKYLVGAGVSPVAIHLLNKTVASITPSHSVQF